MIILLKILIIIFKMILAKNLVGPVFQYFTHYLHYLFKYATLSLSFSFIVLYFEQGAENFKKNYINYNFCTESNFRLFSSLILPAQNVVLAEHAPDETYL